DGPALESPCPARPAARSRARLALWLLYQRQAVIVEIEQLGIVPAAAVLLAARLVLLEPGPYAVRWYLQRFEDGPQHAVRSGAAHVEDRTTGSGIRVPVNSGSLWR